jgi:hypothetical protein
MLGLGWIRISECATLLQTLRDPKMSVVSNFEGKKKSKMSVVSRFVQKSKLSEISGKNLALIDNRFYFRGGAIAV